MIASLLPEGSVTIELTPKVEMPVHPSFKESAAIEHAIHIRGFAIVPHLSVMRADQRLSEFLLDLSRRYDARGYSPSEFVLRMTREEIGSYLGLKLETVSRMLSRFQREGLIQVQGRTVKLLDRAAMRELLAQAF